MTLPLEIKLKTFPNVPSAPMILPDPTTTSWNRFVLPNAPDDPILILHVVVDAVPDPMLTVLVAATLEFSPHAIFVWD